VGTLLSHVFALSALIQHLRGSPGWVVVLAPSGGPEHALQSALTACKPPDASMGGRTLLLPEGGRVTVAGSSGVVAGEGFQLMMVNFDDALSPRDEIALHGWRQQARCLLTVDQNGEVRIGRR